jgi:DNA-binding beta-propeller fold protein YncE
MRRVPLGRWWLVLLSVPALFVAGCHLIVSPTTLAVDPVGARVYVRDAGNTAIRVVDARTHETVARIPLDMFIDGLAVNPSNGELYAAGNKSIFAIDPSGGQVSEAIPVGAEIAALAVNASGTKLFVLHGHPDGISVIDTRARRTVTTLSADSPSAMVAPPGVDHVYLAQYAADSNGGVGDSVISLLETDRLSPITAASLKTFQPLGLALDPSGTRLYAVGIVGSRGEGDQKSLIGGVLVLETAGLRVVASFPLGAVPSAVAVNPAGTRAYVLDNGTAKLTVLSSMSYAILETVAVREGPIAMALNASGTEVYINYSDGTLTIVNALTNRVTGENHP